MIRTINVTLSGTAQIVTIDDDIDTANTFQIQNTHASAIVYVGTQNVTTSSYGVKIGPGQSFSLELQANDQLYAVSDNAATVAIMILDRS
jgi:hypothetical protein